MELAKVTRGICADPIKELERRRKMSEAHMGVPKSEETRRKISESHKGKPLSEETRRKQSNGRRGMKYKKVSPHITEDERKRRVEMRLTNGNMRIISEEHRIKLSEAHKGNIVSEETRRKQSEAMKGKIVSDETRKRMSEAQKKRHRK